MQTTKARFAEAKAPVTQQVRLSTAAWNSFRLNSTIAFVKATWGAYTTCLLAIPSEDIEEGVAMMPLWCRDRMGLEQDEVIQMEPAGKVEVGAKSNAQIKLRQVSDNSILVCQTPEGYGLTPPKVAEIASRCLLGFVVANDSWIVLPLKGHDCLFCISTQNSADIMITKDSTFSVELNPIFRSASPDNSFALVGHDNQYQELVALLNQSFYHSEKRTKLGLDPVKAVLISGQSGSGKTTLIRKACKSQGFNQLTISAADILVEVLNRSHQEDRPKTIQSLFFLASVSDLPVVLHIPDLDSLSGSDDSRSYTTEVTRELLSLQNDLAGKVCLVCESNYPMSSLASSLRILTEIFVGDIRMGSLSRKERAFLFVKILEPFNCSLDEQSLNILTQRSAGFTGQDILKCCHVAVLSAASRSEQSTIVLPNNGQENKLAKLTKQFKNMDLNHSKAVSIDFKTDILPVITSNNLKNPGFDWKDAQLMTSSTSTVAGYASTKVRLERMLLWPLNHASAFERMGITHPKGILLFGPPGCGKTKLAGELLSKIPINSIRARGSDLFSKYLGESEAAIRRLFATASQQAPCIIFIDELEAIAVKRDYSHDDGGSGVNERVLSQILNEMDGIAQLGQVIVLACTNRPDKLDDALVRQGRLEQLIYVNIPSHEDRRHIIAYLIQRIPTESLLDINWLVESTVGFAGADLEALFRDAAIDALKQFTSQGKEMEAKISMKNITKVLPVWQRTASRPSLSEYLRVNEQFAAIKGLLIKDS